MLNARPAPFPPRRGRPPTSPHYPTRVRHAQIAKLGAVSQVDLRELIAWPPFPVPAPAGKDELGPYWAAEQRGEWVRWFARYRQFQEENRRPTPKVPGI